MLSWNSDESLIITGNTDVCADAHHCSSSPCPGTLSPFWNILLWVALGVFSVLLPVLPKPQGILFFLVSLILRSIYTLGLGPALLLLGTVNVSAGAFRCADDASHP